jgi:GcrA cell cycle regulator
MSWTDERVELLKKMWGDGQSASQIAKELGGVTRNAVIGKVHRLGLSNRATTASAKPATASKAEAKPATEPKPKAPPKARDGCKARRPRTGSPDSDTQGDHPCGATPAAATFCQ